jgi:hypothetical protein
VVVAFFPVFATLGHLHVTLKHLFDSVSDLLVDEHLELTLKLSEFLRGSLNSVLH